MEVERANRTIDGERVSELIDSTDDNDEIDYTREETPWGRQENIDGDFSTARAVLDAAWI